MPARLTLYLPDRPARVHTLREGTECVVGRDPECGLRLEDDRVSRRHALLKGNGGWSLADLRSKNGTQVDGAAVRSEATTLHDVSWISFGGLLARFELLSEEQASRQQEEQLRRWQSSVEMQRRLTPSLGLAPLLERLLDSVLELTRTERAFVLLADRDGAMTLAACRGLPAGAVYEQEFAGSIGAVEIALRESRAMATSDAQHDPRLAGRRSIAERSIRALVCVPLVAADRVVGALYADSSRAGAELTELDVLILEGLAGHAALAITVARLDADVADVVAGIAVAAPAAAAGSREDAARAAGASFGAAPRPQTTTASSPADDTGLRWDELLLAHRAREGSA